MKKTILFLTIFSYTFICNAEDNSPRDVASKIVKCIYNGDYACFWDFMAPSAKLTMSEQLISVKASPSMQKIINENHGIKSDTLKKMTTKEYTIALFKSETAKGKGKQIKISNILYNEDKTIAFIETDNNGIEGKLKLQLVDGEWLVIF